MTFGIFTDDVDEELLLRRWESRRMAALCAVELVFRFIVRECTTLVTIFFDINTTPHEVKQIQKTCRCYIGSTY